jgi:hypothetical protein
MLAKRCRRNSHALLVGACLVIALLSPLAALAGDGAVATCTFVRGALLSRSGPAQDWEAVKSRSQVKSGTMLMSMFEAQLVSANKAVKFELYGDIGAHGDLAVMEVAVGLQANPKADLDIGLLRGTVVLTNQKPGPAKVIVRILNEPVAVNLAPGTKLALTAGGRHSTGAKNIAADVPTTFVFGMVLKGKAAIACKQEQVSLSAPPGPAMLRWDSIDRKAEVDNVPSLPPDPTEAEKSEFSAMCAAAARLNDDSRIDTAVELTHAAQEADRLVGVTALGALDALPQLLVVLNDPKHPEVRRQGIMVLRHWLGREPGQIRKFQNVLITEKKLSPAKVKNAISLLIGFDYAERRQPTTYDFLIDCLKHKSLAVRELAQWHLVRLVPEGRDIPFDAAAPPAQQEQTIDRWRVLIPEGQLPRQPKTPK